MRTLEEWDGVGCRYVDEMADFEEDDNMSDKEDDGLFKVDKILAMRRIRLDRYEEEQKKKDEAMAEALQKHRKPTGAVMPVSSSSSSSSTAGGTSSW